MPIRTFITGILFLLTITGSYGTPFLTFESHTEGDGWFEYTLTLHYDPYFTSATAVPAIRGAFAEYGPIPPNWDPQISTTQEFFLSWTGEIDRQPRPMSTTFRLRSENTHWVLDVQGAVIVGSLEFVDLYLRGEILSENVVYFQKAPAIVPVASDEGQSGAGTNSFTAEFIPDPVIDGLYIVSNEVRGIDFSWPYCEASNYTVRVNASFDQCAWSNIAYAYGYTGTNRWCPADSLEHYGNYFRLQLMSMTHLDPLPEINGHATLRAFSTEPANLPLTVRQIGLRKLAVTLDTTVGRAYLIQCLEMNGHVALERRFRAESTSTTLTFEINELPSGGRFAARPL